MNVCSPESRARGRERWERCGCGAAFGKDESLQCRQGLKISREEPKVDPADPGCQDACGREGTARHFLSNSQNLSGALEPLGW